MKNESAFPAKVEKEISGEWAGQSYTEKAMVDVPGLTKRELFAAMAMQGLFADGATSRASNIEIAEAAVLAADALLAELERTNGE